MPIDAAEVRRIARLACLDLDDAAVELFRDQLGAVLDHVRRLEQLGAGAPPEREAAALAVEPRVRGDEERGGPGAGRAMLGAPEARDGAFLVPPVATPGER